MSDKCAFSNYEIAKTQEPGGQLTGEMSPSMQMGFGFGFGERRRERRISRKRMLILTSR